MRKRGLLEALMFIFSPIYNPFFAIMWRQQKRNMDQFVFHLGLVLGFMYLVFAAASFLMEATNFPLHPRGIVLYELVAWSHLIAGGIYSESLYRRYRQFWREDTRSQLLLTGAPPLWIALSISVYPLFVQAYIAFLCLPFYAAAVTLSGISWSTVILTIIVIVLLVGFQISRLIWGLLFLSLIDLIRYGNGFWTNLPFSLILPVHFFAWSIPAWLLVAFAVPLALSGAAT